MNRPNKKRLQSLALPALMLTPALGFAQVDTSEWLCEGCPFDEGYRGDVAVGGTYVSEDSARFGDYTGYDKEGGYANIDGEGSYANDDGYRLRWYAEDLALDSRVFEIEGGLQGKIGFNLGYRELPYRRFDTTETIFSQAASDSLVVPAGWVPAGVTGDFTGLSQALYPIDIGSNRKILDVGGDWKPATAFRVYAEFSRQTRDGIDITSGSSYQQASFLPRYIDYETDQIDAGVQYGTRNASLTLAYYGSYFTNNNTSLTWETPFTTSPGAGSLRMAREPDNDYQQISLSGKYRLSTWDTLLALRVASGRGEQNEEFLPYTINPTITTTPLPRTSLDGKVDTLQYAFTATARPIDNGRVRFYYRYDERDNKTRVQGFWNRVIVDLLRSDDLQENPNYSYDRTLVAISGEYVLKGVRLSAGYNYREYNRNLQEVSQQITDDGWGQIRWSPAGWLDLRIKGGASQRGIDNYDETIAIADGQNPLMRKYNLAYRYRTYGEFIASITPAASPVSFSLNFLFAEDDYDGSLLGMINGKEYSATADLSWAISESASAYLLYGYDSIEALQYGSEDFSFADWTANHDDTFDNFGIGFSWQPADSNFDFDVNYSRGDGETLIDVDSVSGGNSPLPALASTLDSARLEASYGFTDRLDGTLSFRWERFDLTDWALVSETTLPGILTMGAEPWDYDVYAVGIGIRYRFGVSEISLAD